MVSFVFRTIIVLIALINTNAYLQDYQQLMVAYDKGQQSYGTLFIFLGEIYRGFNLDYFYVHLTYLIIMACCLAILTKNLAFLVLLIILVGEILNEQTRFFTGVFLAIVILIHSKKLKAFSISAFLIHPAAFVLSFMGYLGNKIVVKHLTPAWFAILGFICFILSEAIRGVVTFIGAKLGYGYAGTIYVEPLSLSGKAFLLVVLCLEFYKFKHEKELNFVVENFLSRTFLLMTILFSGFAIVSGRLLLIWSILMVSTSCMPKFFSDRKVKPNYNLVIFNALYIILTILAVRSLKFFSG